MNDSRHPWVQIFLLSILLAGLIGSGWYLISLQRQDDPAQVQAPPPVAAPYAGPNTKLKACDVLILDDAVGLIGPNAVKSNTPVPSSNGEVNGMVMSLCGFQAQTGSQMENFAITLFTSMDHRAYDAYNAAKPPGVQKLPYGDDAYWMPNEKQLHVYRDGNWLKITVASLKPGRDYQEFAGSIADLLLTRL